MSFKAIIQAVAATAVVAFCLNCLTRCQGPAHYEVLTGPYALMAVETRDQMCLDYMIQGGAGIKRVHATVFAVGWDDRYIVAKQHPRNDRSVTNYYYLEMAKDRSGADADLSVSGPLTQAEFTQRQAELKLPAFTRTIESLK